jgi:hypothetical protein
LSRSLVFVGTVLLGCGGTADANETADANAGEASTSGGEAGDAGDAGSAGSDPDTGDGDGDVETESTEDGGDTGDPPETFPDCGLDDDRFAPAPTDSPFGLAYALDVVSLDAAVTLSPGSTAIDGVAQADVTTTFVSSALGGPVVFGLGQTIEEAWLDDQPLSLDAFTAFTPSARSGVMTVLDLDVDACSEHRLRLRYAIEPPDAPSARAPIWGAGVVEWDFDYTDLQPGRYLEQWFPASLSFDRFEFTLELEVAGTTTPHAVTTNGALSAAGNLFSVDFGGSVAPHSPMVVLAPEDQLERHDAVALIPGQSDVAVEIVRHSGNTDTDLVAVEQIAVDALQEFSAAIGPYPHGDRLVVYLHPDSGGMEYDGGTTTAAAALRHEIFHMWWGRGVAPTREDDGWIDEAWDVYNTGSGAGGVSPFPSDHPVETLYFDDPWSRSTPSNAYSHGSDVFASLAAAIGQDELFDTMRAVQEADPLSRLDTSTLERALYCASESEAVREHFHRWVYGRTEAPAPTSSSYCDPPR